jgi:hypothetical protein
MKPDRLSILYLKKKFNEIAAKLCSGQGMPDKTFRELVGEAQEKLREEKERASSEIET